MCGQRIALVGSMFLLSAISLSDDAIAQGAEPLRLPLNIVRSNPVTKITVGSRTVQAVVDTGGGGITLSEDVIRAAGGVRLADERVWNDALGREYRVPQFKVPVVTIGGRTFHDIVVIQAVERPDDQGPPVPNTIGQQFLSRYLTVVDYAGLAITLWPPDTELKDAADCGTTRIPMEQTEDPGLVVTDFDTPSGSMRLGWDTGATFSALSESLVKSRRLQTFVRGQTSFYRPRRLSAAGQEFGRLDFVVLPLQLPDFQGVLGANFFSDHVVCLDWVKREVRVR
jgi:gag-polyprotein putative aspartyl protease